MSASRRRFLRAGALLPAALATPSLVRANFDEEPNEADIGFLRDMSIHHAQALNMCQRVLGRDTGDSVQAAAAEVLQNQAIEIGRMGAWLEGWGVSTVPPEYVMGWMGAGDGAGIPLASMPGYASPEELLELSTLEGLDRGRRWLELMRAHHVGGIGMADMAVMMASTERVARLAALQSEAQSYEVYLYDLLLDGPYA